MDVERLNVILDAKLGGLRRGLSQADVLLARTRGRMDGLGAVTSRNTRTLDRFGRGALASSGAARGLGKSIAFASTAFLGGAGLGAALKFVIGKAASFETMLNTLQAVTRAAGGAMKRAGDLAKRLGADIRIPGASAADAAEAMTELAKGGLSMRQAMAATRGTLQLAAAAQLGNAEAAKITVSALNAFQLKGNQATKVADLLAAAATASQGEISDMAIALQQASAVAHQAGLSVHETVTALTLMAKSGIQGSDAGTSLRVMLSRLIPQGKKAATLMRELGLEAFNAQGQMLPLRQLIERYSAVLSQLNPKQRAYVLQTIFGQEAQRAANIILGRGVKAYDESAKATGRAGEAQRLASARTKGFAGTVEALRNAIDTLAITIGPKLNTHLKPAISALAKWVGHLSTSESFSRKLGTAIDGTVGFVKFLIGVLRTLLSLADKVADAVGGWENALRFAGIAWVAFKVRAVAAMVAVKVSAIASAATAAASHTAAATTSAIAWERSGQAMVATNATIATSAATTAAAVSGVGLAARGLQVALAGIKALGPVIAIAIAIDLLVNEKHRKALFGKGPQIGQMRGVDATGKKPGLSIWNGDRWVDVGADAGGGTVRGGQVTGAVGALTGGTGRAAPLPSKFKPTHPTSGLPGFPAADIFRAAGTPVGAPEAGVVARVDRRNEGKTSGQVFGAKVYFQGKSGATYFITHIYNPAKQGARLKKGDVIGYVSAWSGGAPHVHIGKSTRGSVVTGATVPAGAGGGGGEGGDSGLGDLIDDAMAAAAGAGKKGKASPLATAKSTTRQNLEEEVTRINDLAANKLLPTPLIAALRARVEAAEELIARASGKNAIPKIRAAAKDVKAAIDDAVKQMDIVRAFQEKIAAVKGDVRARLQELLPVPVQQVGLEAVAKAEQAAAKIMAALSSRKHSDAARTRLQRQLERHRQVIEDGLRGAAKAAEKAGSLFERSWAKLARRAFQAFDKETARGLASIDQRFSGLTPAERELAELRAQMDADERRERRQTIQERIRELEQAIQLERREEETDAEFRERLAEAERERLRDLAQARRDLAAEDFQDRVRELELRAETERNARDKQREAERSDFEERRSEQREQLEQHLADLHERLLAGEPVLAGIGATLGVALTDPLIVAIQAAQAAWQAFLDEVNRARVGVGLEPVGGGGGGGGPMPDLIERAVAARGRRGGRGGGGGRFLAMAEGGEFIARGPTPILVGEGTRAERVRVTPLGLGTGGGDVIVNINGPVYGADAAELARKLTPKIRDELTAIARRAGSAARLFED